MRRLLSLLALPVVTGAWLPAPCAAQAIYRCTGAHGEASYQSTPCPGTRPQQPIALTPPPPAPPAAAAPTASAPPTAAVFVPVPPPPAPPIPVLYQCVRATDGKHYLSRNGNPAGYYAPLGMVGLPTPLAQQYNAGNRMGREPANAAMVSNYYTFVQDRCRALGAEETCAALRKDWDDNQRQLGRAFKSDRPPLLEREAELRLQLQGCGGP